MLAPPAADVTNSRTSGLYGSVRGTVLGVDAGPGSPTFLSAAVSTIAAFQFRSAATASIHAPDDLAAFFGVFNSCAGLVVLAAQASAGRVLQRLGPGADLMLAPVAIANKLGWSSAVGHTRPGGPLKGHRSNPGNPGDPGHSGHPGDLRRGCGGQSGRRLHAELPVIREIGCAALAHLPDEQQPPASDVGHLRGQPDFIIDLPALVCRGGAFCEGAPANPGRTRHCRLPRPEPERARDRIR